MKSWEWATGVVKVLGFGIAKAASNVVETRTGVIKGKDAYIAPEQALASPVDARADLWSMAVVLWELLTTRRLFKSVNELLEDPISTIVPERKATIVARGALQAPCSRTARGCWRRRHGLAAACMMRPWRRANASWWSPA